MNLFQLRHPTGLALALAGLATFDLCAANIAAGASVTLNGTFGVGGWGSGTPVTAATASTLTDGVFFPEQTQWDQGSVWWDTTAANGRSANNSILLNLGGAFTINEFKVQADDNDTYRVEYWNGSAWSVAWDIPAPGGYGLTTSDSGVLAPITTDALRFTATGGDDLYAVSEIQAMGVAVPEPATYGLALGCVALAGAVFSRRLGR